MDAGFRFMFHLEAAIHFYMEAGLQFHYLLETSVHYFVDAGSQTKTISEIGVDKNRCPKNTVRRFPKIFNLETCVWHVPNAEFQKQTYFKTGFRKNWGAGLYPMAAE